MKKKMENLTVEGAFQNYINEKSLSCTPDTIDNYIYGYQVLLSETGIQGNEPVNIISKQIIDDWKMVRLQSSSPVSTSNQYIGVVRTFVYWLQEKELISKFNINLIRTNYSPIIHKYSEEDVEKLLKKPSKDDDFIIWRAWMITNIIIATGVRVGSVVWLKQSDITNDTITFTHSKTHKVLVFPLSPALKKAVDLYLSIWDVGEWLIPTQFGNRQSNPDNLYYGYELFCKERDVEFRGFHALRHYFAWKMWKEGVDILTISHYLGHSSIEMTRHYVGKLSEADVKSTTVPLDIILGANKKIKRK